MTISTKNASNTKSGICGPVEGADDSMTATSSSSSDQSSPDDDEEEVGNEDQFDSESLPMPRIDSSSTSFVLEVAPRNSRLGSKDPLFQGICLYDGSMTPEQVEKYASKTAFAAAAANTHGTTASINTNLAERRSSSWSLLNMFSKSE